jgi:hypothetical protein
VAPELRIGLFEVPLAWEYQIVFSNADKIPEAINPTTADPGMFPLHEEDAHVPFRRAEGEIKDASARDLGCWD